MQSAGKKDKQKAIVCINDPDNRHFVDLTYDMKQHELVFLELCEKQIEQRLAQLLKGQRD